MILLNPGPVTLTPRVRAALAGTDLCHREPEFAELTQNVLARLGRVYDDAREYVPVMLSGSGTCAVEAMLSTFAPRANATLVVCNGVYGERMVEMLARQCKPAHALRFGWTDALDLAAVERELDRHGEITHLAVVHHETTTGRLNRLTQLAALCRARGVGLLLDAVSSFGGESLAFGVDEPLAVAGTANKCLHGAPGISFVLARRDVLEQKRSQATALYLDLATYYREQRAGWSPYTQAVHVVLALDAALQEFEDEGGWQARQRIYQERSTTVRTVLAELGIDTLVPAADCSSMLTAFNLPRSDSYARVHDALKSAGFVIYAGQGDLKTRIFRIATMGAIGHQDLERLTAALRATFARARGL